MGLKITMLSQCGFIDPWILLYAFMSILASATLYFRWSLHMSVLVYSARNISQKLVYNTWFYSTVLYVMMTLFFFLSVKNSWRLGCLAVVSYFQIRRYEQMCINGVLLFKNFFKKKLILLVFYKYLSNVFILNIVKMHTL